MTRLDSSAPDLADKLRRASLEKQRAACVMACEFAITQSKLEHPLVEQALDKVRSAGIFTKEEKAELDSLAAQLDEEYFALQEAAEEGRANPEDHMRPFSQSRAITALSIAGGEDISQVGEAIYEASAAVDEIDEFSARILSLLQ